MFAFCTLSGLLTVVVSFFTRFNLVLVTLQSLVERLLHGYTSGHGCMDILCIEQLPVNTMTLTVNLMTHKNNKIRQQ